MATICVEVDGDRASALIAHCQAWLAEPADAVWAVTPGVPVPSPPSPLADWKITATEFAVGNALWTALDAAQRKLIEVLAGLPAVSSTERTSIELGQVASIIGASGPVEVAQLVHGIEVACADVGRVPCLTIGMVVDEVAVSIDKQARMILLLDP